MSTSKNNRINYYNSKIRCYNVFPKINGRYLRPALNQNRIKNFHKFVSMYFYKESYTVKQRQDKWSMYYNFPSQLKNNSDGYQSFKRYAATDYGSSVIREMISNNKYSGFIIGESLKKGARGGYSSLLLPIGFPRKITFPVGGQRIFDLAIIHHEFAHTQIFLTKRSNKEASLKEERIAVIKAENPVRVKHGFEPRYTYYNLKRNKTINIITGEIKNGKWTVDKNNPGILVQKTYKDALR